MRKSKENCGDKGKGWRKLELMIGIAIAAPLFLAQSYAPPLNQAVVYEANPRACGGFVGITKRLDAIQKLGVNVLWLMPIYPVGKIRAVGPSGSPYAIADYERVSPEYGTDADFRALVKEAHNRKIAVILDWVANHTAWDHPWVSQSPSWYTKGTDGKIVHPAGTNWQDVADLDFANKDMRKAMIASMSKWVTNYGVDGFRCDAADYVPFDFWSDSLKSVRASTPKKLFMLGEGSREDHLKAGFEVLYGWNFFFRLKEIFAGGKADILVAAGKSEESGPRLRYVTNHDESAFHETTFAAFKSEEGVKTAMTVSTLYGGIPLIHNGQEVGWPNSIPIFQSSTIDWKQKPEVAVWHAELMKLRRTLPALATGTTQDTSTGDLIRFTRTTNGQQVLVLGNVRDRKLSVPVEEGGWKDAFTEVRIDTKSPQVLPPFGCRVLVRGTI